MTDVEKTAGLLRFTRNVQDTLIGVKLMRESGPDYVPDDKMMLELVERLERDLGTLLHLLTAFLIQRKAGGHD